MTPNRYRTISIIIALLLNANFALASFKTDAYVATARSDLVSTQKAIVARVFAENIDVKKSKSPNYKEWGEWIIETARLNKKRWVSLGGNGIYPIAENTICQIDGDTPLLWINTNTGTLHFNPSKLLDSQDFCGKLKDSYVNKNKNANGDKIIPLATSDSTNAKSSTNSINNEEFVNAAIQGNLDKVKMFIKSGANIDAIDNRGVTALVGASTSGKLEIVKYLISQGANVNISAHLNRNNNANALMMASANGHLEIVKFLVANGANVNAKTNDGGTALIMASAYGHIEIMNYLIENGSDISAKDDSGKTALEYINKYKKK